jgi:DNA-binding transcriptional LysR family regulator
MCGLICHLWFVLLKDSQNARQRLSIEPGDSSSFPDSVAQEKALLEGRISVGILVPSDRPVLELLQVRVLIKYPVRLALPKSHPHADNTKASGTGWPARRSI